MKQNQTKSHRLTAKQVQCIPLLVSGVSILQTAETLDIEPCTVHRWKKLPAFRAALNTATADILSASLALSTHARLQAIRALVNELSHPDSAPADRIAAAKVILSLPVAPEPDQRVCTVEGIEQLEKEATMDPVELLTSRFQL